MTPEQAKELLPIITAFSEGKEVQRWSTLDRLWLVETDPTFNEEYRWRIKPDPEHARKAWQQAVFDKMEEVRVSSASRRETLESELQYMLENHPDTPKE